jgi:hypothetical protein
MIINFYLKEDSDIDQDEISVTVIRKKAKRSQSVNAKKLDNLTAVEQQNIKNIISTLEKYAGISQGAKELTYGL